MLSRALATIEISRPHNMIAAGGCVVAGYFLSGGTDVGNIVLPFVFTALVTGLGNLINDYHDRDIDRINKPHRPIPSGRLSPRHVLWFYGLGTIATTASMATTLSAAMFALILSWEILLFFYAWKGKRVALLGNLLIAAIAASAFLGGAIPTSRFEATGFPALLAFLLVMGRELIKGAEDVRGDGEVGASTIAVRYGAEKAAAFGASALFLCVIVSPVPGLIEYYGRVYVLIMELLFVPGLLLAAYLVLRSRERSAFRRASQILKVQMFFGIVAMALGRV
jgi:geranylgeranylglycerol-phosphate geranylgeranyltransferase